MPGIALKESSDALKARRSQGIATVESGRASEALVSQRAKSLSTAVKQSRILVACVLCCPSGGGSRATHSYVMTPFGTIFITTRYFRQIHASGNSFRPR